MINDQKALLKIISKRLLVAMASFGGKGQARRLAQSVKMINVNHQSALVFVAGMCYLITVKGVSNEG